MVKPKAFSTLDIYLASFLSLHETDPTLETRNGKVVFIFDATDRLYHLMNLFNSNEPVPVADFVTTVKTLRGKMLTAKESIRANEKGNDYGKVQTKA